MSYLVVRGWDRYQHYKDRDPPWIKLYRDLLSSESWVLGTDTSRLLQVASILLAARYSNQIPLQWALIRKVASLDCSEKEFNSAVSHLCNTKFFEIQSLPEQPVSVAQSASTLLATCNTETEQRQSRAEQRRTTAAARPDEPPEFAEFRATYPERNGNQPWSRAMRAFSARLAEGHTGSQIVDGAQRYAHWCRVTGKVNTETVMQAATFCGPDKPFLKPWTAPSTKADVRLAGNLDAAAEFMRRTEVVQ